MAEVSLDFEHERARALAGIVRPPGEKLLGERVHAGRGLAGADGPGDEQAGVEPLFGDDEPRGPLALARHGRMVRLADHQRGRVVVRRGGPLGQLAPAPEPEEGLQPDPPDREDERAREDDRDAGRGVVPEADGGVDARIVVGDQVKVEVVAGAGERQFERVRARRSDGGTDDGDRRVPHRRSPLPGGIVGTGATRRGGRHGPAHAEPPRCRTRHPKGPGRSRPRPGDPDRHRRSAGRGPTPSRPATCGTRVPHTWAAFPCTSTPMSFSHLRIGNGLRRTALKFGPRRVGSNAIPNGRRWCLRDAGIGADPASRKGGEGSR